MFCYRVFDSTSSSSSEPILRADHDEDGEDAAGAQMAEIMALMGCENTAVIISRWYGGIKLGPTRFKHIKNLTRDTAQLVADTYS